LGFVVRHQGSELSIREETVANSIVIGDDVLDRELNISNR
jgi:hypothetical protein